MPLARKEDQTPADRKRLPMVSHSDSLRLLCIEANRFQACGVRGKLFLACWKPVRRQNKGDNAGGLFAGQMSRIITWHALLYIFKQIADGQTVPVFLKRRARQIRGAFTP